MFASFCMLVIIVSSKNSSTMILKTEFYINLIKQDYTFLLNFWDPFKNMSEKLKTLWCEGSRCNNTWKFLVISELFVMGSRSNTILARAKCCKNISLCHLFLTSTIAIWHYFNAKPDKKIELLIRVPTPFWNQKLGRFEEIWGGFLKILRRFCLKIWDLTGRGKLLIINFSDFKCCIFQDGKKDSLITNDTLKVKKELIHKICALFYMI